MLLTITKNILSNITLPRILPSIKKFIPQPSSLQKRKINVKCCLDPKMKIASPITSGKTLKTHGIELSLIQWIVGN